MRGVTPISPLSNRGEIGEVIGICHGPSALDTNSGQQLQQQQQQQQTRLGIVLIDHGSKGQASNEHIHKIAKLYEQSLLGKNDSDKIDEIGSSGSSIGQRYYSSITVVKAAHMESAKPPSLI